MAITVSFTDASTPGSSGPLTAWAWDFGDGGTDTVQNPTHDYDAAGTYTVQLVVTGTFPDGQAFILKPVDVT
jgi:PKD repeat protein